MRPEKRKLSLSDNDFEILLSRLNETKVPQHLATLNKYLTDAKHLIELLGSGMERSKLAEKCRREIGYIIDEICDVAFMGHKDIEDYIHHKISGRNYFYSVAIEELQQMVVHGIETCILLEPSEQDISEVMLRLHECSLSLKQYDRFFGAFQNYKENKDDIHAFLSLLVTPVTTILRSESPRSAPLFYSGNYPKWMLASFMAKKASKDEGDKELLRPVAHFISDFQKSTNSNIQSPLAANGPLNILWERLKASKGDIENLYGIQFNIEGLFSKFSSNLQFWKTRTFEGIYKTQLTELYKGLLDTLNSVLPPSVRLVQDDDKGLHRGMYGQVLISMEYKVRVNGETKTLRQPIYCAEYKHPVSHISLGMAAVSDTFHNTFQGCKTFLDDYKKYAGSSIAEWDNPKWRASACGGGLRNANKVMRLATLPPLLENHLSSVQDSGMSKDAGDGKFEKLSFVTAVGIADGCSHSMALISRKKQDFEGAWSQLQYALDKEEASSEYVAPPSLYEAQGMSGNTSKFYESFLDLEKASTPRLKFSEYLHINDDECFAFKLLKGLANLVAMNIVVMFHLKKYCPDDEIDETDEGLLAYIEQLTNALGDQFKENWSDILPGSADNEENSGTDRDDSTMYDCSNDLKYQDEVWEYSHDKDSGLVYRYIFQSKSQLQKRFIEWLREQNKSMWNHEEEYGGQLPSEYLRTESNGHHRWTRRAEDGTYRYFIDIRPDTIVGIYNELEAYYRINRCPHENKIAPRFLGFEVYSYNCIGIELYTFCIHVEEVNGLSFGGYLDDKTMDLLVSTLSVSYGIKYPNLTKNDFMICNKNEHRNLDRGQIIFQTKHAICKNFSNVRFTDENSPGNTRYKSYSPQKLITLLYSSSSPSSHDQCSGSAAISAGHSGDASMERIRKRMEGTNIWSK